MDFTTFINSRDIAEHLRSLQYAFTAPEAAFLVYQSHTATLAEKFAAWEHIIETLPDCPLEERFNMEDIASFHDFLRQYMDLQKRHIDQFRRPDGHVFLPSFRWHNSDGRYSWEDDTSVCFSDTDSCLTYMKQEEAKYEAQELRAMRILKLPVNGRRSSVADSMELDRKGNILSLDIHDQPEEEYAIDLAFEEMWFAFPTPFQRGDILVQKEPHGDMCFVLNDLSTWDAKTCREQGVPEAQAARADRELAKYKKRGDTTDMNAHGYYLSGTDGVESRVIYDVIFDYLSFERLREPLQGRERLLKPLSCLVKGEIAPEVFLDACSLITAEEHLKNVHPGGWYSDEFYEMVGSKREK